MGEALFSVENLSIAADQKPILFGVNMQVGAGEVHVLMGPNGAGKSTLGQAIVGDPEYTVTGGSIKLEGQDITDLSVDKRARQGLFISFQAPVEVPGVPLASFLRAIVAQRPDLNLKGKRYKKRVAEVMELLNMDPAYLERELNVGFSGGEKKKIEMLQLLLLQPKVAILDETDSGLDVDALTVVSNAIAAYRRECGGALIIITHNTRLLESLDVDRTHVMVKGHMVAEGDASLVDTINAQGFEQFETSDAGKKAIAEAAAGQAGE
ncbi:MAG: Fe-S cluster assembly ATPase SufC [Eggerthellaceae bacterium]|jgi:Fe-S cluster assembly ATP-binding protein